MNTSKMNKVEAHYNRFYLGKNGGATKMEMARDIVGGIIFCACLAAFCYACCLG